MTNGWAEDSTPSSSGTAAAGSSQCERRNDGAKSQQLQLPGFQFRPISTPTTPRKWWTDFTKDKAIMVECISRGLFPFIFLVFNLVYWPWYLL